MDIVQLQFFCTIAHKEHLTLAAELQNVSQPAMSSNLQRLEKELGILLFDRIGRNLRLNDAGRIFLRFAEKTLQELNDVKHELSEYNEATQQTLTVYIANKLGVNSLLLAFNTEYPGIFLRKMDIFHNNIQRALRDRNADFISASSLDPDEFGCNYHIVNEETVYVVLPQGHSFNDRQYITIDNLRDENLIMPLASSLRFVFDKLCRDCGFEAKVFAECPRCQIFGYMRWGHGVALISDSQIDHSIFASLGAQFKYVPVILPENKTLKNVLLWRSEKKLSQAAKSFLQLAKESDKLKTYGETKLY